MAIINHKFYPDIKPINNYKDRPKFSVMIPTYNSGDYLIETLKSVLQQDIGPDKMHIEVVDDCSTKDDSEKVVKEIGKGRVGFFRQSKNVGAIENINTCVKRSLGQFVHILHSDDLVRKGFYERLGTAFEKNNQIGAAFCRQIFIDENGDQQKISFLENPCSGILVDALERLILKNIIRTPSIIIRRDIYEEFGGYDLRLFHTADWEFWIRIAARYAIWYEVEPLALYRVHSGSDTSKLAKSGKNIQDMRRAIKIFSAHLPEDLRKKLVKKSTLRHAKIAVVASKKFIQSREFSAAIYQLKEALITNYSPKIVFISGAVFLYLILNFIAAKINLFFKIKK